MRHHRRRHSSGHVIQVTTSETPSGIGNLPLVWLGHRTTEAVTFQNHPGIRRIATYSANNLRGLGKGGGATKGERVLRTGVYKCSPLEEGTLYWRKGGGGLPTRCVGGEGGGFKKKKLREVGSPLAYPKQPGGIISTRRELDSGTKWPGGGGCLG